MQQPTRKSVGDTVVAVVDRERLAAVLATVHRAGFGSLARVFDPARGDLGVQLRRADLPEPPEAARPDAGLVVLALTAPGRAAVAADAISRGGARSVYVTARGTADDPTPLRSLPDAADTAP